MLKIRCIAININIFLKKGKIRECEMCLFSSGDASCRRWNVVLFVGGDLSGRLKVVTVRGRFCDLCLCWARKTWYSDQCDEGALIGAGLARFQAISSEIDACLLMKNENDI